MENATDEPQKKKNCPNQQECLQKLQAILDGEASLQQREDFLQKHLEDCLPCYQNYHLELAIRQQIKSRCCQEAPLGLMESIRQKVSELNAR